MKIINRLNSVLWLYPLVIIAAQLFPAEYSLPFGIALVLSGLKWRVFLLFGFSTLGHLFWVLAAQHLNAFLSNQELTVILGRFGLLGHIILFVAWNRLSPCNNNYLRIGNIKEILRFPFIWWGFREYLWRFILIFCILCTSVTIPFLLKGIGSMVVIYGLLFAMLNSLIEEVLWRGLVLGRVVDYIDEKQALLITSLAFGFYHLSLGFSIWVCFAFSIGGFYMGGCAIKSRGLFASVVMHFFVNMIFISSGIIF